jgi:hypothetical protein
VILNRRHFLAAAATAASPLVQAQKRHHPNVILDLGKLTAKLRALNIERDTVLIFLTDNGPVGPSPRFNCGMRSTKGTPYQGGIRVPFFLRWPGRLQPGKVDRIAAHIDVLPTILDACGVAKPDKLQIDGRSLMGLADGSANSWPDRMLFTQWHRGDRPEPFRDCAVRTQRHKLVNGSELYDIETDPGEKQDIAAAQPEIVAKLREGYTEWFESVSSVRHYVPPRIYLGTPHENPVTLTRQDWRVPPEIRQAVGWWEVDVKRAGNYEVKITFDPLDTGAEARFQLGDVVKTISVAKGIGECRFEPAKLAAGPGQLRGSLTIGKKVVGPKFVEIKSL